MSSTSSTAAPADPTTPPYTDSLEWITAYLTIHSLSVPSRRYSFLLWIIVVFIFLAFAILHWTGARGGVLGARWSKWALPRRTWKKHAGLGTRRATPSSRKVVFLPSNAQLLSLFGMTLVSLALALVGPDYIAPTFRVWQFAKRDLSQSHTTVQPHTLYDASTFDPYIPQYTISKSLWSSSARFGQIAFALFPLCVLFALKAPPFALFAIPFMIQLFFDKLVWLHRWSGRLIWFMTLVHVVLWSIQLARDSDPNTGRPAYLQAFTYGPFIFGWTAFAMLTLIMLLSLHPIRRHFYESFYFMHILLVPLTLLTAGLHHPPIAFWCWVAFAIWGGERLWRLTWWIYSNGFLYHPPSTPTHSAHSSWEMDRLRQLQSEPISSHSPVEVNAKRTSSPLDLYYDYDHVNPAPLLSGASHQPSSSLSHATVESAPTRLPLPPPLYIPPPGYAHAELLPGRTIRLQLITPRFLPWAPGQHFLIHIPSVSRFTSHPFTCASICDEQAQGHEGRLMVFLIRARKGWTQDLWDMVSRMIANQSRGDVSSLKSASLPTRGVVLRTFVDGPFGSSVRARWGDYSTAMIITGGSGVSFGLSVLQYLCLCLSGRDGRHLGGRPGGFGHNGFAMRRIRFVWLVREYSHVQWCACILRRCMSMVPSLQVDIYVTNFKPVPAKLPTLPSPAILPSRLRFGSSPIIHEELEPPHPRFARDGANHLRTGSSDSVDSHESCESDVDLSYYTGEYSDGDDVPEDLSLAHETNILELTNFEGEEDMATPSEKNLSMKLKKEGRLRRMQTRRLGKTAGLRKDPEPRRTYARVRTQPDHRLPPICVHRQSVLSTTSNDRLVSVSPLSECFPPTLSESDLSVSPVQYYGDSPLRSRPPSSLAHATEFSTVSLVVPPPVGKDGPSLLPGARVYWDDKSEAEGSRPSPSPTVTNKSPDLPGLEIDEREAKEVDVMSEHARPGKPRLDKVIADEVERSGGSVVVACCGPTSLDAMVRKIIAKQTNPERIRRGDMRGLITLVSEEFEY
ncbi:ferric reductase like transmembrane component-domain-containing protein [Pisolithus croceorrhizus]|nr:ferric reductase like transmembrane component-domain-containing protein [Pisolithus croceorrhizus]KAI6132229.1 ferric reductase like transmembrane component-domain-containing protein [Pisolithus croceorrhizus]KAI6160072.1 ferric reductase like transmembrane component-domain-containing protein [Pisolithus thermaeus]